jgi:DNA (cytosine-5)-methyltransferase 1
MPNVKAGHLNLIPQTRERLRAMGVPYVIENVPGAPLIAPVMLCGTMFGMKTSCGAQLRRHRLFETNWCLMCGLECRHKVHRCGATARDPYLEKHRDRTISVIGHQAINPWRERQIVELEDGRLHRTIVSEKYRERVVIVTGHTAQTNVVYNQVRETFPVSEARIAMGIDWMPMSRLSQAIPPAFTEFIGRQLMEVAR